MKKYALPTRSLDPGESDHDKIIRLDESVHQLCCNHIPHIYDLVKDVQWWVRGTAIGIALALMGFVIDYFLRR